MGDLQSRQSYDHWDQINPSNVDSIDMAIRNIILKQQIRNYFRQWFVRNDMEPRSSIVCNEQYFRIKLEVQNFNAEEVNVKIEGNSIIVQCVHEERENQIEFVSKRFVRKYDIPEEYNISAATGKMDPNEELIINIPKFGADVYFGNDCTPLKERNTFKVGNPI